MKKRYIVIEFILILLFLVIPPLFVTKGHGLSKSSSFSPEILIQAFISIALFIHMNEIFKSSRKQVLNSVTKTSLLFQRLFWFSIALGILMLIFALMQALTFLTSGDSLAETYIPVITSIKAFIFVFLTIAIGAFYEEVLYRQFIPELLLKITDFETKRPLLIFTCETIVLLLFAFAHRYLGWIAVLNSFLCGIILRVCFKKTGSVLTGTLVHFTYNMTLVLFSSLI